MRKILLTLTMCLLMSTAVFASYEVKGTKYYYNSDTHMLEYEDENGKMKEYGPCISVSRVGNAIMAATSLDDMLYGLMDMDLNEITPREYTEIYYDEETDTYRCDNRFENTVTFYDGNFNEISQPDNLVPIEGSDYYMYTEIVGTNPNKWRRYICDKKGNRLLDEYFRYIKAYDNTIIAMNSDREYCVLNSNLETIIPYGKYEYIRFEGEKLLCSNGFGEDREDTYYSPDLKPVDVEKEIKPLFDDYYYQKHDDGLYYICDAKGNVLKDKGYCEIDYIEGRIIVSSSDKYPRLYGLLDEDLNEIFEEKYFRIAIYVNEKLMKLYLNGSTETYDADNKLLKTEEGLEFVTPINGMVGRRIYDQYPDANMPGEHYCIIIDNEGNALTPGYAKIDPNTQPGNTLIFSAVMGHSDIVEGVLNSNLDVIVQPQYGNMYVKEENGTIYIENVWEGSNTKYYDLNGNKYDTKEELFAGANKDNGASAWAKDTIEKAVSAGIVPKELQSDYTKNITRQEFCKLAVMTYMAKTGNTVKENAKSPFTDISDDYVTAAYKLKIAAGKGNGKFAPNDSITRQEAAVMLNNMARLIGIESSNSITGFNDEKSFADWARDPIYSVSAAEIMTGTGNNNFSPLSNYTREQAISTMYRLYE